MMTLYGLMAIASEAVWTFVVYKYAKYGTISKLDHDKLKLMQREDSRLVTKLTIESRMIKEHLAMRDRRIEMMASEKEDLDRKFNNSITNQSKDSAAIVDLTNENLALKELLKKPMRKRSGNIGE